MNILFLSLIDFASLDERNIYTDLLRVFVKHGHNVYIISPSEKRKNQGTHVIKLDGVFILKLKIGNVQKTNLIEKGLATVCIEPQFIKAIKKYFSDIKFDFVLYPTPPITFCKAVKFVKKRDNATTYLMLKDIFPQNAVDIELMKKTGIKGLIYKYFRNKEKQLYHTSDYIGCMSQANVDYVLKNNPEIDSRKIEIFPNSIEVADLSIDEDERMNLRKKYNIPLHRTVFVYGGNLGAPQGIEFLIDCLKSQGTNQKIFFLIIGDGTDFYKIDSYIKNYRPKNVQLFKSLPKTEYEKLVSACDVGLIFLDYRFTIPNFPSRILSYMQAKIPVFAVTDSCTDIGTIIINGKFGWWCESNDRKQFSHMIDIIRTEKLTELGKNGFDYLNTYYSVEKTYKIIEEKLDETASYNRHNFIQESR